MKRYRPLFVLLLLTLSVAPALRARRVRVKVDDSALRRGLHQEAVRDSLANVCPDTLTGDTAVTAVHLYGYDKPHNSRQESLFIKSELEADTIREVTLSIEYMSVDGVPLHSRRVPLKCTLAPGASQRLHFVTWDKTNTFYYYRTPPARVRTLTPYKVRIHPARLLLTR